MAAALGAGLALAGMGIFAYQGINKTEDVKTTAEEGTYRGKMSDPSLYLNDPYHQSYDNNMPVDSVNTGAWGMPRTNYRQVGGSLLRTYGKPSNNAMTNV